MPAASALNAVASEPIVYLGPSLSRREAQAALPGCCIRPPIRRGNLYRDRILRSSVFVILDGVFFQQEAISPREVIDVVRDGALVVGACSLGAVRAAECWPAGMRGLGSIYRLFRRGILLSDDEVALAFEPGGSYRSFSVPLINVRYALRHAVRKGRLSPAPGRGRPPNGTGDLLLPTQLAQPPGASRNRRFGRGFADILEELRSQAQRRPPGLANGGALARQRSGSCRPAPVPRRRPAAF